jgi:adenosine deaminase
MEDDLWLSLIPKVELHIHLEGAIPHDALWQLMQKYGGDPEIPDQESLGNKFIFKDFSHFIDTWVWKNSFIRSYEDIEYIAEMVARDMASQNIRYSEMHVSPPDFHRHGLETQCIIEAVRKGFEKVDGIVIGLVPDLVRDFGPQKAIITLHEIEEVRDLGVLGIGLGGSEQAYPPDLFTEVYRKAREMGFHTTVHAGEAAGADSIWRAIHNLNPDRIGHGTNARQDDGLLDYLKNHQIPLEMCPISNVKTGVVPSIEHHPIHDYYKRGLLLSVNTDDPKMFGNTLAIEYKGLVDSLGFSRLDIKKLILMAIQSSWMPESEKDVMIKEFQMHPCW